jgi:hypothetical protein
MRTNYEMNKEDLERRRAFSALKAERDAGREQLDNLIKLFTAYKASVNSGEYCEYLLKYTAKLEERIKASYDEVFLLHAKLHDLENLLRELRAQLKTLQERDMLKRLGEQS